MKPTKTLTLVVLFLLSLILALLIPLGCAPDNQKGSQDKEARPEVLLGGAENELPPRSFMVPVTVPDTSDQSNYYHFGWQSFIALNWPADPAQTGNPDTTKQLGAAADEVVWEAYKEKFDVFLPNGDKPTSWTTQDTIYCGGTMVPPGSKVIGGLTKNSLSTTIDEFDQAGSNVPLIDGESQYVRYEIRINEAEFNYLMNTGYYDGSKQKTDVKNKAFQGMPKNGTEENAQPLDLYSRFGSTEIKASWRIFPADTDANILSRYYTRTTYVENPDDSCLEEVKIGLVGIHILRLTPQTGSSWYWATFEQVDNVTLNPAFGGTPPAHPLFNSGYPDSTYANGYSYKPEEIKQGETLPDDPRPVLVNRTDSILSEVQTINLQYNQMLRGTVWQYYQMVGTVNPPTDGHYQPPSGIMPAVNIASMYNATLETYTGGNCISCHSYGFPQGASYWSSSGAGNDPAYYKDIQIFTFLLGDAQSPE